MNAVQFFSCFIKEQSYEKSFLPPQSGFAVSGGGRCRGRRGRFLSKPAGNRRGHRRRKRRHRHRKCPANAGFKAQDSENERQQGRPPAQPRRSPKAGCDSRTGCYPDTRRRKGLHEQLHCRTSSQQPARLPRRHADFRHRQPSVANHRLRQIYQRRCSRFRRIENVPRLFQTSVTEIRPCSGILYPECRQR